MFINEREEGVTTAVLGDGDLFVGNYGTNGVFIARKNGDYPEPEVDSIQIIFRDTRSLLYLQMYLDNVRLNLLNQEGHDGISEEE